MNNIEATASIVIAMINNKLLTSTDEVSKAYKDIYQSVVEPNAPTQKK